MKIHHLLDFVFVPRCAFCRERLLAGSGALCEKCRASYAVALADICPYCGAQISSCTCAGERLERAGVSRLIKLFAYHPGEESVQNALIYRLKHSADRRVVALLAQNLADALRPHVSRLIEERKSVLLTYAPRSRRARRAHGFDHMRHLTCVTARLLDVPFASLLTRKNGSEQKKQESRGARYRNMREAYRYRGREVISGKHIILLDDITTSGATLAAAARVLRRSGARSVSAAVLGATPPN